MQTYKGKNGKVTKQDKFWHATGLPCSNTLSKCGRRAPGCSDVGQCPCTKVTPGRRAAETAMVPLVDFVASLKLADATQHFSNLYFALAAMNAHGLAALASFGPDMGMVPA
jgi:hypothetical protein